MRRDLIELWPQVDRVALCIHRPSGRDPRLRAVVDRLQVPAGSMLASAARYLASGELTLVDLQLMSRYESRTLVAANADRHVAAGFLEVAGDGVWTPTGPFRDAARLVLDLQAESAAALWQPDGNDLDDLVGLLDRVASLVTAPVATAAYDSQVAHAGAVPPGAASSVLARVTELRYLRADLHAHGLAAVGLAGPRARSVARLWKGHAVSDDETARLREKGLVEDGIGGIVLTEAARRARDRAEEITDAVTEQAFAHVPDADLSELLRRLRALEGEDPRAPEDR